MPAFLVPRHVSAHRISAIALYRALLQQSKAAPLPTAAKTELQNIVRNRFKQSIHLHSYRRLRLAFQAGYEAVEHLDASAAGDESSTALISSLLSRAPAKVKAPPSMSITPKKGKSKDGSRERDGQSSAPAFKPSTELFSRPHPLSQLSGKRHVPVLFTANGIPVLRIKKPQPQNLSSFLKSRIIQRQKRHDRRHWLREQTEFAQYEDLWDDLVEKQGGMVARGGHEEETTAVEEPSWAQAFVDASYDVENLLKLEGRKNSAMAKKMQGVVDREREVWEGEREGRREARRLERVERRKGMEKEGVVAS
ncbi:hypothetical protein Q7P37_001412 [Cladosporium fusiforme]